MTRILIADDHPIVREGWASLLARQPGYEVVSQCSNGEEAVAAWARLRPDVGLLDLKMPGLDGVGVIERILAEDPQAALVVMTSFDSQEDIFRALRAGARSYLLKDTELAELTECLEVIQRGGRYIPRQIGARLSERLVREQLTPREQEALECLGLGLSNGQIAERMGLTVETVKGYVKTLRAKLEADSRGHAVPRAREFGLIP